MTPEEYLDKLQAIGWFDHLPPGERERIRPYVEHAMKRDPMLAFDGLLVSGFDTECVETGIDGYCRVLQRLAQDSA